MENAPKEYDDDDKTITNLINNSTLKMTLNLYEDAHAREGRIGYVACQEAREVIYRVLLSPVSMSDNAELVIFLRNI